MSDFVLLIRVIGVNIGELVGRAVAHFGAAGLKNVGNLECVVARLNDEQGCADELEHVLSQEAHVRHVSVVLRTRRLREGRVRVVDSGLEGLHLVLVVVLVIPQAFIVDVEGAVWESPVSDLIILSEYIVHEVVGPHKCGESASRAPLKDEVGGQVQWNQRLHELDGLDDILMPSEEELLSVDNHGLILIALVTTPVAVLDDEAVPVGEELVLGGVRPEHVVVVIGVFPAIGGPEIGLRPVKAAGKHGVIGQAAAPAAALEVHDSLL